MNTEQHIVVALGKNRAAILLLDRPYDPQLDGNLLREFPKVVSQPVDSVRLGRLRELIQGS